MVQAANCEQRADQVSQTCQGTGQTDVGARANYERHEVSALVENPDGVVVHIVCRHAPMIRPEGGATVGSRALVDCPVLIDDVAHSSADWHLGYTDGHQGVCDEDPGSRQKRS